MSPVYLNPQPSSPIPFLELKGDQQHSFQVYGCDHHLATCNNSSYSYNSYNRHNSEEILSLGYSRHDQQHKVEKMVLSHEKASDLSSWLQSSGVEDDGAHNYSVNNLGEKHKIETVKCLNDQKYSRKWKPSKVRIMQKMMATSKNSGDGDNKQQQLDHLDLAKRQSNDGIRVCSDCHTTTTPLWRSGPQGPKSLCNACGIRQRKARRAAMAASTVAGYGNDKIVTSISRVEAPKPKMQEMKSDRGLDHHEKNHTLPLKKRSKIIEAGWTNDIHNSPNAKKLCFEDFALSSNKDYLMANSKRSFPRDEEEGAILLMALSCGLACSS